MATFTKFNNFTFALASKLHNLGADTLYAQLLNTAPDASADAVETDLPADLSTANGYTAGGVSLGVGTLTTSGGVAKLVIPDKTVAASGGPIGPFRYVAVLNNTASSKDLIGFIDYGASITLADGESLLIDFDGSAGGITI